MLGLDCLKSSIKLDLASSQKLGKYVANYSTRGVEIPMIIKEMLQIFLHFSFQM